MNSLSYLLRFLAIAAAIVAAVFFFQGKDKLEQKQSEVEEAQKMAAAVKLELEAANTQIQSFEETASEERDALAKAKRDMESIRAEMHTAQQEAANAEKQLQQSKKQIAKAGRATRLLREELLEAEGTLVASSNEEELGQLHSRIEELTQANISLRDAIKATRELPTDEN